VDKMTDIKYHWWLVNFKDAEWITKGGLSCAYCATESKNLTLKEIDMMQVKHNGQVIGISYIGENSEKDFGMSVNESVTFFYGG
jgi:hypothetical protein